MASGRKRRAESDSDIAGDYKLPELPPKAVVDILSRLPVKSVFICRRVCKLWLSLISGSDFAKLHLSRSQVSLLLKPIRRERNFKHALLIDLEIAPFVGSRKDRMKLAPQKNLPIDGKVAFSFLNSCNGLLCLFDPVTEDPIYVCNPILGEYITLPKCDSGVKSSSFSSAFGFTPTTNEYKVVRSFRRMGFDSITGRKTCGKLELEIYTLGKGSWRSKGKSLFNIRNDSFNAFLKGAIHWLAFVTEQPDLICCFDFATEQFRAVPGPLEFPRVHNNGGNTDIGVLRDCLSICEFANSYQVVDIWVMKDYGVKESWSKHLVIEKMIDSNRWPRPDYYQAVMILESGQVLMLINEDSLCVYDPKSDKYKNIHTYGSEKDFHGIAHIPSFVSLRDVARGEDLKMCCT